MPEEKKLKREERERERESELWFGSERNDKA